MDTPLERPGKTVEVEGRLEVEEVSMTEWCQVRRKKGQVETDVVAGSRGWEEYKNKFPHLAYNQRHKWSERKVVKEWLAGGDESVLKEKEEGLMAEGWLKNETVLERKERRLKSMYERVPYKVEVEKWLRGGGGQE